MNQTPPSVPYASWLQARLADAQEAHAYLEAAIEEVEADGNQEAFLLALRNVVNAQGGVGELAQRTGLNREHLYRALSRRGNPRLDTVSRILQGLGFRLRLAPSSRPPASGARTAPS